MSLVFNCLGAIDMIARLNEDSINGCIAVSRKLFEIPLTRSKKLALVNFTHK